MTPKRKGENALRQGRQAKKREAKGTKVKSHPGKNVSKADTKGLTVKKKEDMPEWYAQVCIKAELADYAPIKGCMVIRPAGYAIWQRIMDNFNTMLLAAGVENAYFPLFIPETFFQREAEHAEGFKPEVAWVEGKDEKGNRFAIRPTSETIIYDSFSRWIRSWRDLPMRVNQWCNIVRWEVQDVKLFLRSREFLWQEGHCAYETSEQRHEETLKFLEHYREIAEDLLAVPVILGEKTERERFAGADRTYTIESLMPDGKALQLGTTHDLSRGFATAFGISYQAKDGSNARPWQNSWGFSTRLIGALVLMHGDDKGLVLPPRVAFNKVAVIPIIFEERKDEIVTAAEEVGELLEEYSPIVDTRDEYTSGWKFNEYELKGIPLRIEIGPRDIDKKQVVVVRRDTGEKIAVPLKALNKRVGDLLEEMQGGLFLSALRGIKDSVVRATNFEAFSKAIKDRKLVHASHCGDEACELAIKEATAATARCIPLDEEAAAPQGNCIKCKQPAKYRAYFARAY